MIIGIIFMLGAFLIYNFKKKLKSSGFNFQFNGKNFNQGAGSNANFNFNDFKGFDQQDFQNFANQPQYGEVQQAKDFFGFTSDPTKDEIKKRYKELARKYHPDINEGSDNKMKELNHFKEVLIKVYNK